MRRPNEILGASAPDRAVKADPARLPFEFNVPEAANLAERAPEEADRIEAARRLGDGASKIVLPLSDYRGVAIRLLPGATETEDRVAVVLSHTAPAQEVILYLADDDFDVIAEWRLWATTLGLPLLMEGLDGRTIAAEDRLGEVEVSRPRPRRRHSLLSGRRPRFLTRRRTGKLPLVPFVHQGEREIIASE
ncbi:hypothetical protein IZ6_24090 [Terrihabitans soli]|uniref:Uncharacterized protein n=1 Tax=Terrihabitans soli TaxID=708113 RepID=A0A6S6QMI9_9HYPH|nr:DUF6101 family protein [Terrihabitans soli]BCJ91674.1 hypothetical protein IZ6_24090 [Terrihabitans soli]